MKFKIEAGAELDLISRGELREELAIATGAWREEISRGVKWRKFSAQGVVGTPNPAGTWLIGAGAPNNSKDTLGPDVGFVWAVTRIAVSGNGFVPGTDLFSVYVDEISPSRLVISGLTRGNTWDVGTFVLHSGEALALSGAGTGVAGTDVTVSGQAVEVPAQLAWQLL